jgi:hypothetical protein
MFLIVETPQNRAERGRITVGTTAEPAAQAWQCHRGEERVV